VFYIDYYLGFFYSSNYYDGNFFSIYSPDTLDYDFDFKCCSYNDIYGKLTFYFSIIFLLYSLCLLPLLPPNELRDPELAALFVCILLVDIIELVSDTLLLLIY
jgi:hypothetical protein